VTAKQGASRNADEFRAGDAAPGSREDRSIYWKAAAFAALALAFAIPGAQALRHYRKSFAATIHDGELKPGQLDELMPKQIGEYKLNRAWQEVADGGVAVESAAYAISGSSQVILGVWLPERWHNMHESWRARGEDPQLRGDQSFITAQGRPVSFDTAFYSDGITDSLAGNAFCTPASCILAPLSGEWIHFEFSTAPIDFKTRGQRAVSIFFRVEMPHQGQPRASTYDELSTEAQHFLSQLSLTDLSRKFQ
jgi:hypothetical protein